jgi:hypothetical protein
VGLMPLSASVTWSRRAVFIHLTGKAKTWNSTGRSVSYIKKNAEDSFNTQDTFGNIGFLFHSGHGSIYSLSIDLKGYSHVSNCIYIYWIIVLK